MLITLRRSLAFHFLGDDRARSSSAPCPRAAAAATCAAARVCARVVEVGNDDDDDDEEGESSGVGDAGEEEEGKESLRLTVAADAVDGDSEATVPLLMSAGLGGRDAMVESGGGGGSSGDGLRAEV